MFHTMRKLMLAIILVLSIVSCKKIEDPSSMILEINETSFSVTDTLLVTFKNNTNSICKYLVCDTTPVPHITISVSKFNTSKNIWEGFLSPFCGEKPLYLGGEIECGAALKDTIMLSQFPYGRYRLMIAIKEYLNNIPVAYRYLYSNEFLLR
jgi:hypothetical protein